MRVCNEWGSLLLNDKTQVVLLFRYSATACSLNSGVYFVDI